MTGTDMMLDARPLPANLEAEQALLGAILVNNEAYTRVSGFLQTEHFAEEIHRRVFDVAGVLIREGRVANPITLKTYLGDHDLGGITVPQYLARLAGEATTIINAADYGRLISEAAARREVIRAAQEAVEIAHDPRPGLPVREMVDSAIEALRAAADGAPEQAEAESVDKALDVIIERAQSRLRGDAVRVPTSGLADFDSALGGGLWPGRLIVLAGRPAMGKTALVASIFQRSTRKGNGAALFSLEIDDLEMTARLAASAVATTNHPTNYVDLLSGRMDEAGIERLCHAREWIGRLPLEICTQSGLSISQVETRAVAMKRKLARRGSNLDVVAIDYLQLLKPSDRYKGNNVHELGEIVLASKNMAKRLNTCVILLSQLSRDVETRDNKRPILRDLRGSGNIEEHADAVGMLYRPEYYDRNDPKVIAQDTEACLVAAGRRNILEVSWEKNRLGAPTTCRFYCDVARCDVDDLSRGGYR